jgi:hypothetical protein
VFRFMLHVRIAAALFSRRMCHLDLLADVYGGITAWRWLGSGPGTKRFRMEFSAELLSLPPALRMVHSDL